MFKDGEVVKLKNKHGEDFDVKILNSFCDDDKKMYYTVEPLEFKSFTREVLCEQCYKKEKMTVKNAVQKMLKNEHITQKELANMLGFKSKGAVTNALSRNLGTDKLLMYCEAVGYEVHLVPKNGVDKKERTIVIESAE